MRVDAHFHMEKQLLTQWQKLDIKGIMNCATPQEYSYGKQLQERFEHLSLSCGIHPWNVETMSWEEMLPYLEDVKIIGEIGMDSIWCSTDLNLQKNMFERQLQYASITQKPVILHTKGQEKEIVELLVHYPNTYLVHWYSCSDYLDAYRSLSPYFTIGPSVVFDASVQQVVERVDEAHLLVESDGLSAIEWAFAHSVSADAYAKVLDDIVAYIAKAKKKSFIEMKVQILQNYEHFLNGL